jgi:uncharacterized protein
MIPTIDVYELARTGGTVDGVVPVSTLPRLLHSLAGTEGQLRYVLIGVQDTRGRPAATLELKGTVTLTCDHCGQAFSFALANSSRFYFVADERELAAIAVDEVEEEPLVGSRRFDLGELIEDEAILALPIAPRHASCQAAIDRAQPATDRPRESPFAVLAELRKSRL